VLQVLEDQLGLDVLILVPVGNRIAIDTLSDLEVME